MKILYIHGFNGSSEGHSFSLLKKHLPQECKIIGMDYDQNNCNVALRQIQETIQKEKIDLVIGCSLGGFQTLRNKGCKSSICETYTLFYTQECKVGCFWINIKT